VGNGLDFGEVEADAFVEGGEEVGWFDAIERGDGVRGGPGGKKGFIVANEQILESARDWLGGW
jgi:hypothetical protein